ncbi:MAG: twin-arginine translocation signal domain-containing protein [Acidobacteriia bacterium]|nr:twin-arginine translocation signal domain-containing protein [Terriglobia bacterium]
MSKSKNNPNSSRRDFLKTAGATAGAALIGEPLWTQGMPVAAAAKSNLAFPKIDQKLMITPEQALEWAKFKAKCGPTWAGSAGWKQFTDFLISKMPQFGAVDLDFIEIPYDHHIVDDWPDRRTHIYDSGMAVEKLVTDGTPVPVVASYGMTSGFTPPEGITAPMLFYDPSNPPSDAEIAGKILVFQTDPYPPPPYSKAFLDSYTMTDYEWRSPGKWGPLFEPVPTSVTTSYHSRWVWSQIGQAVDPFFLSPFVPNATGRSARIGINGHAAGMVVVYDLSPGAAFGLTQRSVFTPDGKAGLGAKYVNCPTLALDRVNGAKVLADAKAGKTATLTLIGHFQRDVGKAMIAYLPGKNYGTPLDEQVMLATHTDAMSLVEEVGGLGMLAIMSYFNKIPKSARPRTLVFYFDCRHFMPGGEPAWPQFDYYNIHPEHLKSIVATLGMEHMGGRQTIETGPGRNEYVYSPETPENGGVITSLFDVYNNNVWLVEAIAKAATDNHWPRVDVKAGSTQPGVNGGFQGQVKSPMNKGRMFKIPGIGLAADWPGAWTQSFAQVDTEAGPHGFDEKYFMQQISGLSQLAGELSLVKPVVIDLGWGDLKSALIKIPDSDFVSRQDGATQRQKLVDQYVAAFRKVEVAANADARSALKNLATNVSSWIVPDKQAPLSALVDGQISKLS